MTAGLIHIFSSRCDTFTGFYILVGKDIYSLDNENHHTGVAYQI
jgi:hypothetical protein